MKKTLLLLLAFVLITPVCFAENIDISDEIYRNSNIADIANDNAYIKEITPEFDFRGLTEAVKNKESIFKPKSILTKLINLFSKEITNNLYMLFLLIVLAIIWGIVTNIESSYLSKSVTQTAFFAFYPVFLGILVNGLFECSSLAKGVISDQVVFMKSAVPVYIGLTMSTGNVSVATGMEPIFLYFIQLIGGALEKFVLPLIFWIAILNMINCITEKFSIKKLIDFVKQIIKWGLGILMTVFIGILSMSGIATSMTDGLGLKTLKFAVGNFVPVVGGLLSDSVSTVLSSIIILKNAIGVAGVITLVLSCIIPIIKMLSFILIFKFAAGIVEPISDKKITDMISEAGNAITFIFLALLSVTIMFVLGITIVINAGYKVI